MKKHITGILLISAICTCTNTFAGGTETFNDCRSTPNSQTCTREGHCAIQGSAWDQTVYVDKRDKFDTQGWPGLCDMVHVTLVQGRCVPLGSQVDITSFLSSTPTTAGIPSISGTLACGGDDGGSGGGGGGGGNKEGNGKTCSDETDNDDDGNVDCADPDCFGNRACR